MRKFKWWLNTGLAGCTIRDEITVDDTLNENEIDEIIKQEVFNEIDWGYEEVSE